MKKIILGLFVTVFFSGCSALTPIKEIPLPTKNQVELEKITPRPMQTSIQNIEAQIAGKQMFTYRLPIANETITKREVSGFLDENKTGKISRVVEGIATTREYFYFEQGNFVALKLETIVEGKISVKEMLFENKKITSLKIDGVEDMKNPNIGYLEEGSVSDAEIIFSEFIDKKLNAE